MIRSSDINRLNEGRHVTGHIDDKSQRVLFPRRNRDSGVERPLDVLLRYLEDASFAHVAPVIDFHFDNLLLLAFVERWRLHSFHMPWSEYTITLHDVGYYLGLQTHGESSLHREPWQGVRYAEPFTIKITWLKARLIQLPADAAPDVLWHYAHYYMLRLIGGLPMTDKSSGIVHARWIPLIVDFERCMQYSWGSPMLAGPTTLYAWLSMGDLA
ncbi:hypothetical protein Ahy_B05g075321 [Arachis hypogaea]|uniref:Aminotransferase-like plant mobile domain-containing protein n=1 Tax=Arachis hypogaea TaxID=3818 RepID=A0A444Z0Y9_ARAHY|nr:hypothetical protein Ahy_B05g075321 [Arachis hypogaea]